MAQTDVTPRRIIPEEEVYRQVFDAEVNTFLVSALVKYFKLQFDISLRLDVHGLFVTLFPLLITLHRRVFFHQ